MEAHSGSKGPQIASNGGTGKRIDLHCHSEHSNDGTLSVQEIMEAARSCHLDGIAITDHNSLDALEDFPENTGDLILIPGCEVSSNQGHILALGVKEVPTKHRDISDTIREIRELGGVPVLSHPFRAAHAVGVDELSDWEDAAFEGMNGRSWRRDNGRATRFGKENHRIMTGGSDAHTISEIGRAWSVFPGNVSSVDDVLDALRNGEVTPGGKGLSVGELSWSKIKGMFRFLHTSLFRRGGEGDDQGGIGGSRDGTRDGEGGKGGPRGGTRNGKGGNNDPGTGEIGP